MVRYGGLSLFFLKNCRHAIPNWSGQVNRVPTDCPQVVVNQIPLRYPAVKRLDQFPVVVFLYIKIITSGTTKHAIAMIRLVD